VYNTNECLSESIHFEIDFSFLSQDIENLQKHAELFLRERRATYRREAPIGRLVNKHDPAVGRVGDESPSGLLKKLDKVRKQRYSVWRLPTGTGISWVADKN
jgi:hypothetical protein